MNPLKNGVGLTSQLGKVLLDMENPKHEQSHDETLNTTLHAKDH